jgi:hypothetical protein
MRSRIYPISTSRTPSRSCWFRTISIPTKRRHCMKPSRLPRQGLVERFEWNYTPKHGSWLDLAESELGVLSSQCLDRRIPDKQTLIEEAAAWGARSQSPSQQSRLAVHNRKCPCQTQAPLPSALIFGPLEHSEGTHAAGLIGGFPAFRQKCDEARMLERFLSPANVLAGVIRRLVAVTGSGPIARIYRRDLFRRAARVPGRRARRCRNRAGTGRPGGAAPARSRRSCGRSCRRRR